MRLKRRPLPAVSDDPRLHGDAASPVCHVACCRKACGASPAKGAPARVMACSMFESARAFCGGECLSNERLAAAGTAPIADPSKSDAQIVITGHGLLGVRGVPCVDAALDFPKCRLACDSAHRSKSLILRPSAAGHPGRRLRLFI